MEMADGQKFAWSLRDAAVRLPESLRRRVTEARRHFAVQRVEGDRRVAHFDRWMRQQKEAKRHAPGPVVSAIVRHVRRQAAEHVEITAATTIAFVEDELRYCALRLMEVMESAFDFQMDYLLSEAADLRTLEDLAWLIVFYEEEAKVLPQKWPGRMREL